MISPRNMSNSWMKDYDDAVLRYDGAQDRAREMAAAMLAEGDSVEKVVRVSRLSETDVLALRASFDLKR